MKKKLDYSDEDFCVDNPTPRIPIVLCLSVSQTMFGKPIEELNKGLNYFLRQICENDDARYSVEICVLKYSDDVKVVSNFKLVNEETIINLEANGSSVLGTAVNTAIELIDNRKLIYKKNGTPYYKPWLVLLSDSKSSNESNDILTSVISKCNKLENNNKIIVFPIGIGENADYSILNKFSSRHRALRINNLKFNDFFKWLSRELSVISSSQTGDTINTPTISTWGNI